MTKLLQRLITDDGGQDLIEYALLSALIGVVGILAWNNVGTAIGTTYSGWDSGVQGLSATTPDPISSGS
jgi:Flp pilus assembly pilin Flp